MRIRLKYWRASKGLTKRELAQRAKVSEATIYRIENEGREPSDTTAGKLAIGLGIRLEDLAEGALFSKAS